MMKQVIAGLLLTSFLSVQCMAADSVDHSAQASKHSVLASVEGIASGASVASAVVAVPVVLTGAVVLSVGAASQDVGNAIHQSHQVKPLPLTTKVITRDPTPNQVIINQTVIEQR